MSVVKFYDVQRGSAQLVDHFERTLSPHTHSHLIRCLMWKYGYNSFNLTSHVVDFKCSQSTFKTSHHSVIFICFMFKKRQNFKYIWQFYARVWRKFSVPAFLRCCTGTYVHVLLTLARKTSGRSLLLFIHYHLSNTSVWSASNPDRAEHHVNSSLWRSVFDISEGVCTSHFI